MKNALILIFTTLIYINTNAQFGKWHIETDLSFSGHAFHTHYNNSQQWDMDFNTPGYTISAKKVLWKKKNLQLQTGLEYGNLFAGYSTTTLNAFGAFTKEHRVVKRLSLANELNLSISKSKNFWFMVNYNVVLLQGMDRKIYGYSSFNSKTDEIANSKNEKVYNNNGNNFFTTLTFGLCKQFVINKRKFYVAFKQSSDLQPTKVTTDIIASQRYDNTYNTTPIYIRNTSLGIGIQL